MSTTPRYGTSAEAWAALKALADLLWIPTPDQFPRDQAENLLRLDKIARAVEGLPEIIEDNGVRPVDWPKARNIISELMGWFCYFAAIPPAETERFFAEKSLETYGIELSRAVYFERMSRQAVEEAAAICKRAIEAAG